MGCRFSGEPSPSSVLICASATDWTGTEQERIASPFTITVQAQPFEILRLMLERPGDVVTRDELRQRLWPHGTFVDFEHSLNAAVKRLRAALGDDADNPRYVETLPRRGYRFIGATNVEGTGGPGHVPG